MEEDDFKFPIPPARKIRRPNPAEQSVELDEQASRVIESQRQFTAQYIYTMHDKLQEAYASNMDQRMKYQEQPPRFFDSESQLNDTIQKFGSISAYPDLVPDFINSRVMKIMVRLLDHPNQSIVGEAVEVICQFMTMEIEDDDIYEKHLRYCVDLAQEKGFFKQLLKNVGKLDENKVDEYQIVYKILRIVVQLLDFSNALRDLIVDESEIMRYLADRVMPNYRIDWRPIDDNKYISSEILVELLQNSKNNRFTFGNFSGVEVLIESVAIYKKQIPDNEDEKQFVSNLLNLLYIMMTEEEGKREFNRLGGVPFILLFVANKNRYSKQAFKVLSFGFTPQSCLPFIESGGLKYLFAILMKQGLKQKNEQQQRTIDENCLSIIKILLLYTEGIPHDRVLNKLREKNFEKLLRFVEMRVEYSDLVREDEEIKDTDYPEKLLKGLRVIQQIDEVILIIVSMDKQLKANLKEMLKTFNIVPQRVNIVIRRYCQEQLLEGQRQRLQLEDILKNVFMPYFMAE